jgi:Ca-activated chloride channel family protein
MLFAFSAVAAPAFGEDYADAVKQGNEALKKGDIKKALEYYHIAEAEIPESPELDYNIGNALHEQGSYEEAAGKLAAALSTTDIQTEARAHYNLGNTYYRMGDYPKAIESYQNALELAPNDTDAKFNLELARRMLKEHTKPQQEQQEQQQKEQQQEEQQPQQQEQEEQNQEQGDSQEQDEKRQEDPQDQQQQQKPQDEKEMSKEDAERILNALRDQERETQEKIKRANQTGEYTGKDW